MIVMDDFSAKIGSENRGYEEIKGQARSRYCLRSSSPGCLDETQAEEKLGRGTCHTNASASPDRLGPASSASVTSAYDPLQLRESCSSNPVCILSQSHGNLRQNATEYQTNFKAPQCFGYVDGAWRDVFPPQFLQNKKKIPEEKIESTSEGVTPLSNWFTEVLELRRRASEYKRRAQGTHFSREHLVQLLAQQSQYWDAESTHSSVASLDALALEPAKPSLDFSHLSSQEKRKTKTLVDKESDKADTGDSSKFPFSEGNNYSTHISNGPENKGKGSKVRKAWQEDMPVEMGKMDPQQLNTNQNAACQTPSIGEEQGAKEGQKVSKIEPEEQGRMPTPVLRQQKEVAFRHHLDRTTPSADGVLVSAASQKLSARLDDTEKTSLGSQSSPKLNFSVESLTTAPLLGRPTPDTHALRDEDAESDPAMGTQHINDQLHLAEGKLQRVKEVHNEKVAHKKLQTKCLPAIDERMGLTYNKDKQDVGLHRDSGEEVEDDDLSISAVSVASSSSLASQVYERTRRRCDFWDKPHQ